MALLFTAAQMQAADRWAIETLGVPGLVLMENAGHGVVRTILRALAARGQTVAELPVVVLCGAGQNGGDGFVIARHLRLAGASVRVLLALPRAKIAGDAGVNAAALERMGDVPVLDLSAHEDSGAWQAQLEGAQVIVDAIFGTGLRADVRGAPAAAIAAANDCAALRVAVDLPSGLDADDGQVRGVAFFADVTCTMATAKLGLWLDASAKVGRVEVVPLGVPLHTPAEAGPYVELVEEADVRARLPQPPARAHKGSRGHVLLVAGSRGKTGAAVLSATAALRAGAGLCTVASTGAGQQAIDAKVLEVMSARYADGDDADEGSEARLEALLDRADAVAVGPGVPTGPGMRGFVKRLAESLPLPLVVDADGLNHLGDEYAQVLTRAAGPRVLTPHPGEAARLLGSSIAAVEGDRLGSVRRLAEDSGAVVVLKGARSLIAAPDGRVYINPVANPALATAGSGDVLTGVIAALLGQGLGALDAAVVGVFAHGQAAALASAALGSQYLVAGDLPLALARWLAGYGNASGSQP